MARIIENKLLPFPGFVAMNLFGVILTRDRSSITWRTLSHEAIHTAQMRELLYIGFYVIYFLEWIYRLVFHTKTAYRGLSFEVEAYDHQGEDDYLIHRRRFAQWRHKD